MYTLTIHFAFDQFDKTHLFFSLCIKRTDAERLQALLIDILTIFKRTRVEFSRHPT